MKRRTFLRRLALGSAAAILAPELFVGTAPSEPFGAAIGQVTSIRLEPKRLLVRVKFSEHSSKECREYLFREMRRGLSDRLDRPLRSLAELGAVSVELEPNTADPPIGILEAWSIS